MRAIIIGAGRGQRLMPTTADAPKCFAKVQRKRILDWVIDAFAANGISDICFIGGYLIERVREEYPAFTFCHNVDWQNNNIMESLMYAQDFMDEPFVCCYSDTLISPDLVAGLLASEAEIALSVDTKWQARYEHRTEHPPNDAEKLTVADGRVTQVHRDIDPSKAYGEYTGVAKFGRDGGASLKAHYSRCREAYSGKPFREAAVFEKAYLIHLLQDMLEAGVLMHHTDTPGEYMEIDTQQDFELAQTGWKI
ncbi:MAG: phosphocholine cytidylyltransferase family protein [Verrucomicrobia bacterium]|jgi:L-glutamine-phosphate cytidylyltransferase|nr:phosphocholine cytidylyltransferase family protein [Verrucomicrobiota bacterium]MDB4796790.1 phosphocholine cytidylyltransferase family protein [bacterium]